MLVIALIISVLFFVLFIAPEYVTQDKDTVYAQEGQNPTLSERNNDNIDNKVPLVIENIFTINGTNAFSGPNIVLLSSNDILFLDDHGGKVKRIKNGHILEEPLIDLNAYSPDGLLGIATAKNQNGSTYVFLYLNEAPAKYGNDVKDKQEAATLNDTLGYDREGDRLYRYKLVGNRLVEPKILLTVTDKTTNILGEIHHGGELLVGPDNAVYLVIGDIDGHEHRDSRTKAQNYENGTQPDGRAGILRITQDGEPIGEGILGNTYPLNLYYAYGIRNSFGMDFDPVTGNLWNTENGPDYGDEINLVEPGFNSGWNKVQGFWKPEGVKKGERELSPDNLVDFNGKGNYSAPEFVWTDTVAPTALKFFNSEKFGEDYENDMFVADINNGNIYHFDLNENRTELVLSGPLKDKVADKPSELEDIIFAKGFNGIVDLQVGPDGYLYVVSYKSIFRIRPISSSLESLPTTSSASLPTTSSASLPTTSSASLPTTTNDTSKKRSWTTGVEMPNPRSEVGAAALGGRIYIVGGFDADGNSTDVVEAYDPRRDR